MPKFALGPIAAVTPLFGGTAKQQARTPFAHAPATVNCRALTSEICTSFAISFPPPGRVASSLTASVPQQSTHSDATQRGLTVHRNNAHTLFRSKEGGQERAQIFFAHWEEASMAIGPEHLADDVMRHWPVTIKVFLEFKMKCIGCPCGRFHTMADACREHHVELDRFLDRLQRAMAAAQKAAQNDA